MADFPDASEFDAGNILEEAPLKNWRDDRPGVLLPISGSSPHNYTDNAIDIGSAAFRWRDAHFSEQIFAGDGTEALPSRTYGNDPATGNRLISSGVESFSSNATEKFRKDGDGIAAFKGTAALPGLSFLDDRTKGIHGNVSNELGFSIAGIEEGMLDADGFHSRTNAKAWVNFNGVGAIAIRDSENIASVGDLGIGKYNIIFDTDPGDVEYAFAGTAFQSDATNQLTNLSVVDVGTTACEIRTIRALGAGAPTAIDSNQTGMLFFW